MEPAPWTHIHSAGLMFAIEERSLKVEGLKSMGEESAQNRCTK